jgi:hypothetical protein
MKILLVLCVTVCAVVYGNPIPDGKSIDMLRIPLNNDKELDVLTLANEDGQLIERNKRTIGMLRQLFPTLSQVAANDDDTMDANAINEELTRVVREISEQTNTLEEQQPAANEKQTADLQTAESKSVEPAAEQQSSALDELTLDNEEQNDENRNKRFLNFGFGGSSGSSDASSGGGGSGNFLFDIIRLVGGNSGTEQADAAANAPDAGDPTDAPRADGYTEGIPGPVTRLFVLANRGLSNLIQDLILRIAQTSERVVNFKARLITSLI